MSKLKPKWVKTDIPGEIKIKLWRVMKDNPTFTAWQQYIADHPGLFTKSELNRVPYSRDTYTRLQQEIREIPLDEIRLLPDDLQVWVKGLGPDVGLVNKLKVTVSEETPHKQEEALIVHGLTPGTTNDVRPGSGQDYQIIGSKKEEQVKFLSLLQQWRERVQFVPLVTLLRMYWQKSLQTEVLRQAGESQQVAKAYDNAQRRHAQSIHGPVSVLLGLEQDGLFLQLRQSYPDDPVWKAQDSWGLAYGVYLDAFHYWCAGVKFDIEDMMGIAVSEGLRQGNRNTGVEKKDLGWLKKQGANWVVFPALIGKVVSCDLLRLGINELAPNPCWFFILDELRNLRDESITQGTQVLQSFLMTQNEFDPLAPALWEHQVKTKEDTNNLLHSLQALQAAKDEVQSKLTPLQSRLCSGSS